MPWFTRRVSPRCPVEAGKSFVVLEKADRSFDLDKYSKVVACYAAVKAKPAYRDESALFAQIDFIKTYLDGIFTSGSNTPEVKGDIRRRIGYVAEAVKGNAMMTDGDKLAVRQYLNAIYKFTMHNLRMARRQTRRNAMRVQQLRRLAQDQERRAEQAARREAQAVRRAARRAMRNLERATRAAQRGRPGRSAARAPTPESPNSPNIPNLPELPPLPNIVNSPNSPNLNLTGGRRKTRKMYGGLPPKNFNLAAFRKETKKILEEEKGRANDPLSKAITKAIDDALLREVPPELRSIVVGNPPSTMNVIKSRMPGATKSAQQIADERRLTMAQRRYDSIPVSEKLPLLCYYIKKYKRASGFEDWCSFYFDKELKTIAHPSHLAPLPAPTPAAPKPATPAAPKPATAAPKPAAAAPKPAAATTAAPAPTVVKSTVPLPATVRRGLGLATAVPGKEGHQLVFSRDGVAKIPIDWYGLDLMLDFELGRIRDPNLRAYLPYDAVTGNQLAEWEAYERLSSYPRRYLDHYLIPGYKSLSEFDSYPALKSKLEAYIKKEREKLLKMEGLYTKNERYHL